MKYSVYEGFRMKIGGFCLMIVGIVMMVKSGGEGENFYVGIFFAIFAVIIYLGGRYLTRNYKDC